MCSEAEKAGFRANCRVGASGCWIWQGAPHPGGYGMRSYKGHQQGAHRVSWLLFRGEIPPGLCVLHKCDVPLCVNPEHLFIGTRGENNKDRASKGRSAAMAAHPHAKLTEQKVRLMRKAYATGTWSYRKLARAFGVSGHTVRFVVKGFTWKAAGHAE